MDARVAVSEANGGFFIQL